ncbi:HAD family hydrolase [Frondihabitans australicus]|uniref:HAD family hydrolase n=1 Tax=Frondihabitans australicus TaxID=386892 RepID=UPI000EABDE5D|nr:HAD family hydrolase [Frondihabitans australicus]
MRCAAVVFDLDGTLFDYRASALAGLTSWLASIGVGLTPELEAAWFELEERTHVLWRDGVVSWAEQRRIRLREFLPRIGLTPAERDDDLDAYFEHGYLRAYRYSWRGFDDVDACLDALTAAGFPLGILTNGSEELQRGKLDRLGVLDLFHSVLTAEGLGVAKPRAAAFHRSCAAFDLPPSSVLYVGDDYAVDIEAGRAAGLQTLYLDRSGSSHHGGITTLQELPSLVEPL